MKLTCNFEVIVLRARSTAQSFEIKPHHATGTTSGFDLASLDVQNGAFVLALSSAIERIRHLGVRRFAQRLQIQIHLL